MASVAGWRASAVAALVLAVHPAYIWQTVFDSGLIATWMLSVGLLALALAGYARAPGLGTAFRVGLAMEFGVWARANFLWLLAALFIGIAVSWRAEISRSLRHAPAAVAGALAGGFPFLLYQWISVGGTWEALSMYPAEGSLLSLLPARLVLLNEVLLADREHRAMWGGTPMPMWQAVALAVLAVVCLFACARVGEKIGRAVTIASALLIAMLLSSKMAIGEHHLIVVIPLLAVAAGIASARSPVLLGATGAAVFALCASWWHITAWSALAATGGVGLWSDGSYRLADEIATRYSDRVVTFVDWGLRNQAYVLTRGGVPMRELFGTAERAESGEAWEQIVKDGGVFVRNGPGNRQFPRPSEGLDRALADAPASVRRTNIFQRNGDVFAEVIDTR